MHNAPTGESLSAAVGSNQMQGGRSEQPWFVLSAAHHYDQVLPSDPSISHFYSFEADQSDNLTFAIPDGCIDIVFDCDELNPSARVCGSTLEARNAHLKHKHRYFGVRFAMGALPDFLDAAAGELVEHELNLLDVAPETEAVFTQIITQKTIRDQVALFEGFYSGKPLRKRSTLTAEAVRAICNQRGDIRIGQLEALTGYTTRTLQRNFHSEMGMSPKVFSRIVRCQSALHNLTHQDRVIFSELACELGFSDQSHFLREFKKLVSTTPVEYQRRIKQSAYLQRFRHS